MDAPLRTRKRSNDLEIVDRTKCKKKLSWLHVDWRIYKRVRKNGNQTGKSDYFFYPPLINKQLRSRREVEDYIRNNEVDNGAVIDAGELEAGEDFAEENINIHEPANEEMNINPNVDLEGAHQPLMIVQDLNELPPEAEWADNGPAYPPADGN
ncbi:hypothetical protein AQUCO_01300667v1 [Aquilegia coerulea]|uniref:MBD domain-containing protein n=1 Tax=Aquilegia coerulea TaxID=218851 RepID=A0A2G5E3H5_AQUCA|nr:hypothetical protein AQUCO_01300667v1 [Aquilegia coerulea]